MMLKKVKDYLFHKIISNMNIDDIEPFLRKTYSKKSAKDCYVDFSCFLNGGDKKKNFEVKKLHENIWFGILSKEYKMLAIQDKKFYRDDENHVRLFRKEKDDEVKECMFISYIENKKASLETYVSGNYYGRGKVSSGFELEDLEGVFSGKIIQKHIHENGLLYFHFLEDVKVKNKNYRLSEADESKFYKLFREISFKNKSLGKERAHYFSALELCGFKMNENNEDFINLIECYIVHDNSDECRRMKDNFIHSKKLICMYENMLLREKLLKEVPEEGPTQKLSVRRKRL